MSGVVTIGESLALGTGEEGVSLIHAGELRLGIGGAESNVAIGVRRLGVKATWIGRVGADPFGARIVRELRAERVDVRAIEDAEAPTAFMVKERLGGGRTRVLYQRRGSAGSRLAPGDLDPAVLGAADIVHLTGITAGLSGSALAAVRAAIPLLGPHTRLSFDVNHRAGVWGAEDPRAVYTELVQAADVVFAGLDEAALVLGEGGRTPEATLRVLADLAGGDVVLKLGADGCLARVAGKEYRVPAVPVAVVDTVGAGDAFVAGYLSELVLGRPPRARLATAVQCGAFACLSAGDWEGLPTRAELSQLGPEDPVRR